MMLDVAEALNPLLDEQLGRHAKEDEKEKLADDITLQLVFFDGEEAFVDWTDTDSVYGARCVPTTYYMPVLNDLQESRSEVGNHIRFQQRETEGPRCSCNRARKH